METEPEKYLVCTHCGDYLRDIEVTVIQCKNYCSFCAESYILNVKAEIEFLESEINDRMQEIKRLNSLIA